MTLTETIAQATLDTVLNSSFSTLTPHLQLAWDSTSLDALERCPRYYQHSIIEGHGLVDSNAHLKFGTIFHSATELYSHERAQGSDHDSALLVAIRHTLAETWDFAMRRPWASDVPTKTRDSLLRTVIWYLDKFRDDPLQTYILANGKAAVELSFRFDSGIRTSNDEPILLCGHIDKVVLWNDEILVSDKKTTGRDLDDNYFREYTPSNQVSLYSIAGIV